MTEHASSSASNAEPVRVAQRRLPRSTGGRTAIIAGIVSAVVSASVSGGLNFALLRESESIADQRVAEQSTVEALRAYVISAGRAIDLFHEAEQRILTIEYSNIATELIRELDAVWEEPRENSLYGSGSYLRHEADPLDERWRTSVQQVRAELRESFDVVGMRAPDAIFEPLATYHTDLDTALATYAGTASYTALDLQDAEGRARSLLEALGGDKGDESSPESYVEAHSRADFVEVAARARNRFVDAIRGWPDSPAIFMHVGGWYCSHAIETTDSTLCLDVNWRAWLEAVEPLRQGR